MNYDQTFIGKRFIDELEEIAHDTAPDLNSVCTNNISIYGPYGYFAWGSGVGNCNGAPLGVRYSYPNGVQAISSLFAVLNSK